MEEPRHPRPDQSVLLDGRFERSARSPLVTAIIALIVAFLLFQIVSMVTMLGLMVAGGVELTELISNMEQVLAEQVRALLIGNTVGQFLGIGLVAYLFARLHTSRPWPFLRLRPSDGRALLFAAIGVAGLIPVAQVLGAWNEGIPLPEWLRELESAQMEVLERALFEETSIVFNLFVLALTPAICEELLFRGYAQRQAERALGAAGGILFSGVVFGLYHLRISQLLPLTLVGLYFAYLAWHYRSLWPAILGHFLFNGFSVVVGAMATRQGANIEDIDKMQVPWYLFLTGLVILGGLLLVTTRERKRTPREPDLTREIAQYE